jgi:phosphate transport system permease protein
VKDKKGNNKSLTEFIIEKLLFISGILSVIIVCAIFIFLFKQSLNIFKEMSVFKFLFGTSWVPVSIKPEFGILPMILGSIMVTLIAIVISVPLGVLVAVYISKVAPKKLKTILKVTIEFLAAIPSVVVGFLGVLVVATLIKDGFHLITGFTALTGGILLAFMSLPTIVSVSEDAISSVTKDYEEASLALGATKCETIFKVIVPAAKSGILAAIMLGVGRAIGETMTVMMVTGNAAVIPTTIFAPVRTMTATIAAEMGEAVQGSLHYNTLFGIGAVLFIMTFIINYIADSVLHKKVK